MKTDSGMRHGRWEHKGQREGGREMRKQLKWESGGLPSRKHISFIIDAVSCVSGATWKRTQHVSNAINSPSRNNTIWSFCTQKLQTCQVHFWGEFECYHFNLSASSELHSLKWTALMSFFALGRYTWVHPWLCLFIPKMAEPRWKQIVAQAWVTPLYVE